MFTISYAPCFLPGTTLKPSTTNLYYRKHNQNQYHVYISLTLTSAQLVFYASPQALVCCLPAKLPVSAAWLSLCFCTLLTCQHPSLPLPAKFILTASACPCALLSLPAKFYTSASACFPRCLFWSVLACLSVSQALLLCLFLRACMPAYLPCQPLFLHACSCLPLPACLPACLCLLASLYPPAPLYEPLPAFCCLPASADLPLSSACPCHPTLSCLPAYQACSKSI
jgi:hypothetical protein